MDCMTGTDKPSPSMEDKTSQDNILLDLVKEVCSKPGALSDKLNGKVKRIIADCDMKIYTGLHKLSTACDSSSTILGLVNQISADLTFEEQAELNSVLVKKIQEKIPVYTAELQQLSNAGNKVKSNDQQIKSLQQSLDEKFKTLEEQESEKMELMIEWLNFRLQDAVKYSDSSTDMLTLKSKMLTLKSKILHLQILQNIFTETNQSIKAYSEIRKDLSESIRDTEHRIKNFREMLGSDD